MFELILDRELQYLNATIYYLLDYLEAKGGAKHLFLTAGAYLGKAIAWTIYFSVLLILVGLGRLWELIKPQLEQALESGFEKLNEAIAQHNYSQIKELLNTPQKD